MTRRKYHDAPGTDDVIEALHHIEAQSFAQVELALRPSKNSPWCILVRVEFRARGVDREADPVHTYQAAIDTRRRVELASVLHRVLHEAWASYHGSPWTWTGEMRRENVRSDA